MERLKKYIWILSTIILIGTNVGTIVYFVKYYGGKIESNTTATNDNTDAVTELTKIVTSQRQWNIDHDKRHEDHIHLHEAERQ